LFLITRLISMICKIWNQYINSVWLTSLDDYNIY